MYINGILHIDYRVLNCCHLVDIVICFDLWFGFKWFGFDFIWFMWFDLWFAHHCRVMPASPWRDVNGNIQCLVSNLTVDTIRKSFWRRSVCCQNVACFNTVRPPTEHTRESICWPGRLQTRMLWPLNSPDVSPVDYKVWSVMDENVYKERITDVNKLTAWNELISAVRQWRTRLNCYQEAPLSLTGQRGRGLKLFKIMQHNSHFAVQGHSRSPTLLPIESS